jgi:hypothetical protein
MFFFENNISRKILGPKRNEIKRCPVLELELWTSAYKLCTSSFDMS